MDGVSYGEILTRIMVDVTLLAGIPLAAATALGFVLSIIQAVTSIQDQTISQTAKIATIAIILMLFGPMLAAPLFQTSEDIFSSIAMIRMPKQ